MKRLAVAVFGLMMVVSASGAKWEEIVNDDGHIYYIDKDSVKKTTFNNKPLVGAWAKVYFKKDESDNLYNGKYVRTVLMYHWVSCPEQAISTPQNAVMYDIKANSLGSENLNINNLIFKPIIPDSIQDGIYIGACYTAFREDMANIGENPSNFLLNKLKDEYPIQIKEMQGYIKKNP